MKSVSYVSYMCLCFAKSFFNRAYRLAMPFGVVPDTADQNISENCQAIMPGMAQTMMHLPMQGVAKISRIDDLHITCNSM